MWGINYISKNILASYPYFSVNFVNLSMFSRRDFSRTQKKRTKKEKKGVLQWLQFCRLAGKPGGQDECKTRKLQDWETTGVQLTLTFFLFLFSSTTL